MRIKKDKLKVYTIEIILLIILFFTLFVSNIMNRTILAVLLLVFSIITCKIIEKRNVISIYAKQVTLIFTAAAAIYLSVFYLMGLYFGYYNSVIRFSMWAVKDYIIPIAIIIISSELIRNVMVAQKAKLSETLTFIIMVIIDLLLYQNIYNITTVEKLLEVLGFVIFASISCNLLYNYTSKRFGVVPTIVYRLITVLYVYIIPFIPNVFVFFRSFLRMIYPFFIYLLLEALYAKSNISITATLNRKKRIVSGSIIFIITTLLVMLISCQFKFGIIVIGSGSMTGTIDKGDAIVFEKHDKDTIKTGQVIVYLRNNQRIVHRVIEIKNVNGQKRYITKGDANTEEDKPYITEDEILGTYKFKISYIGYPSLWLRDLFE